MLVEAGTRRRPYRRLAHPGRRDTWTRASILASLHDWVEATGRAPRRQDWTGERPARASLAQRRWMREHPRWPSSSCVAQHFGSWGAALEAAGLDSRRLTFHTTVAERVARAARAGGRRARADGDRRAARRLALVGPQLPGGAQLPPLRRAAHYAGRRGVPRVHAPRADGRACVVARGRADRDPRLDATSTAVRRPTATGRRCRENPGVWEAENPRWPSAAAVAAHMPWRDALRAALSP